jgi:hypothetical protein
MKPPTFLRVLTAATPLALAAVLAGAAQADAAIGDAGVDNPHVLNHGATLRVTLESAVSNQAADDALARNMADSVAGSWIGGMIDYAIRNSPQRPTTCQATATATDPNGATGTGSATVPVGMTTTQIDIADQTPGTTWAVGDIDHLNVQVTCADGRGNSQVAKATLDQDALAAG